MVKHIQLVLNRFKDTSCLSDAAIFTEQAHKLGLKQVLSVETVFDDEGHDLMKLFDGNAEF